MRKGRIYLAVPHGAYRRSALATVRQSTLIEATRYRHLAVVSPAHALVQLAARVRPEKLQRVAGSAFVRQPRLLAELGDRFVDLSRSRLPQLSVVRALLDRFDAEVPDESVLEVLLDQALFAVPELPEVVRQAPFPWWPEGRNRVDRWLPDWRLIVEADGRSWHARIEDFERDHWRDNEANAHGCHVMRFTWPVLDGHVETAIAQLTTFGITRMLLLG
jgi:very-short-patch-repair endonuclease